MKHELDFTNDWVDPSFKKISITQLIETLKVPFDSEKKAAELSVKQYNMPGAKYYHMTKEDILEQWSSTAAQSTHYGALSDLYIEARLTKTPLDVDLFKLENDYDGDERLRNNCDAFDEFYALFGPRYELVARECSVYYQIPDTNYYINGRFDALFRNRQTGKYLVVDWKTSKELEKTRKPFTVNFKGPVAKIYPALNWYEYTHQVYFYKTALIANYLPEGTTVDDVECAIVLFHQTNDDKGRKWEFATPAFEYDLTYFNKLFEYVMKTEELKQRIAQQQSDAETQAPAQFSASSINADLPF